MKVGGQLHAPAILPLLEYLPVFIQSQSGSGRGGEKIPSLPLPGIELWSYSTSYCCIMKAKCFILVKRFFVFLCADQSWFCCYTLCMHFWTSAIPKQRQLPLLRGCIQKFPDWPPGARTVNGTALCHYMQLYRYFVSQSSEFCRRNPLCCFSTSVYYCCCLFRYGLSPETFGYTVVTNSMEHRPSEANSHSAGQYITRILGNPKAHYRVHKGQHWTLY
jgi:hypothetical protein